MSYGQQATVIAAYLSVHGRTQVQAFPVRAFINLGETVMFEIFLILAVTGLTASIFGKGEKSQAQGPLKRRLWELTDEAKAEKKRRQKQRECRTFLFLIPTLLCFVPLAGGGLVASSRCTFKAQCTQEVYQSAVRQFADQYATALYSPVQVAQSIQPNLKIVFWVGMAFIYLQMLVWIIAARTLISLWVHDVRCPSER